MLVFIVILLIVVLLFGGGVLFCVLPWSVTYRSGPDRQETQNSQHALAQVFSYYQTQSSHQPDSSILARVFLVSFILATAMLTLKEDRHVFQCILLLQSENYFSLCSLVMVVQVGILQNTLAQERKKKNSGLLATSKLFLPLVKNGPNVLFPYHIALYTCGLNHLGFYDSDFSFPYQYETQ